MSNNYENEKLVKLYTNTKDKRYLEYILENNKAFVYFLRNYVLGKINVGISGLEKEDILQEGYIGLIKAVNRFNEDKGVKFTTYASKCVIRSMKDYLKKEIEYRLNTKDLNYDIDHIEIDYYYILLKFDVENMIKSTLDPLEERIILLHYGFNGDTLYSIENINELLNIKNTKYVIQKSLNKLRKTETAKEYKKDFYSDKLKYIESKDMNPEIKIIKKICCEKILQKI